ncbi:MAG: sensor histidine kinase [Polyangiales bacterium]
MNDWTARRVWLAAICLIAAAVFTSKAHAQDLALDVTDIAGGHSLRDVTYVLEDPGGQLTFEQVRRRDGSFQHTATDTSFGFSRSAFWVRFDVVNPSDLHRNWLLELGYPHLDRIDLYVMHSGALDHALTGDLVPFSQRAVDHPNFVFEQEARPRSRVRYYVRAQSSGVVRVPLSAWLVRDFLGHDSRMNLALWIFYGAVLVMACFNLAVTALIRQREHLYFSGLLLCMGLGIFTLSGQTFQFLLPNQPVLCNRVLAICIATGVLFVQLYARDMIRQLEGQERLLRTFRYTLPPSLLLVLFSVLAPKEYGQRGTFMGVGLYLPFGLYHLISVQRLRIPRFRWTVLSFYCLSISLPLALMAHAMVLPPTSLMLWAGHIGCAAYSVLASLALPARVNVLGEHLAGLNAKLSENVDNLKRALTRAEELTEATQRATKVKDEFMATMSHELRTPLNAIINVPQGLLRDFPELRGAQCRHCGARYLLDEGDVLDGETPCEDCQSKGTLVEQSTTKYVGSPSQTAHFLRRIERSGQNLLQMVNGVLDYSKMEAGRLELELNDLDLNSLLTEAIDELTGIAATRGIAFELQVSSRGGEPTLGDSVRLRQVLRNLLANAIKFSENDSIIRVTWERDEHADTVAVIDQGIGIAPENHERVFASFEQVHKGDTRKYGGTGLGLSISRSLVRMHGGELWVDSRLGHGATFRFRLPRAHGSAPTLKRPA